MRGAIDEDLDRGIRWPLLVAVAVAMGAGALAAACGDDDSDVAVAATPAAVLGDVSVPADNPHTDEKLALGRLLFFDPRLSGANQLSCASCHLGDKGLSDGLPRSIGAGGELPRNSPTLWNIGHVPVLGWNGNRTSLEDQAAKAIPSPVMAQDAAALLAELVAIPEYAQRFEAVFGPGGLTIENIARAIATYERSLLSYRSPFDRFRAGDEDALSDQAKAGMELFFDSRLGCSACHVEPLFTDNGFHNLGVPQVGPKANDDGRFEVTMREQDRGTFKTPTLRNVERSAPYMHDGVFATLEEVLEFYAAGGGAVPNRSPLVQPFDLDAEQRAALVAFLRSLTDQSTTIKAPRLP